MYKGEEAQELHLAYAKSIERTLADIISPCSIAYWLHLSRRIAPNSPGPRSDRATIGFMRATLDAAIQKYGQAELCNRVNYSTRISVAEILGGMLQSSQFKLERDIVTSSEQLVLTDFGVNELEDYLYAEHLAYEIWSITAHLRSVAKGATVVVSHDPLIVDSTWSPLLRKSLNSYDSRCLEYSSPSVFAKGVVFFNPDKVDPEGILPIPSLNAKAKPVDDELLDELKEMGYEFEGGGFRPNFIWGPFALRDFLKANKPFWRSFEENNGVRFSLVIATMAALILRAIGFWHKLDLFFQFWMRAYSGPDTPSFLKKILLKVAPDVAELLNDDSFDPANPDFERGWSFLKWSPLKSKEIDLLYPGPHSMILPCGSDKVFVDYAWLGRRIYDLLYGISIENQTFKGVLLEKAAQKHGTELPVGPCKALDGTSKQIDVAVGFGDLLVIVECKTKERSIGFEKGQIRATKFRYDVLKEFLSDVDKKVYWLTERPVGKNYDLSNYKAAVGIVVTPFVEYVPKGDNWWWLDEEQPRVLGIGEFYSAIQKSSLADAKMNIIGFKR